MNVINAEHFYKEHFFDGKHVPQAASYTGNVESRVTDPPVGFVDGSKYIVPVGATYGSWVGHDNAIAVYKHRGLLVSGAWYFISPLPSAVVWIKDEELLYFWNGVSWVLLTVPLAQIITDRLAGASTYDFEHVFDYFFSSAVVLGGEVTDGGGGTVDVAAGRAFIKTTNTPDAHLVALDFDAVIGLALADDARNFVYLDYNGGTPLVRASTNSAILLDVRNAAFAGVFRSGVTLHIINAPYQHANYQNANNVRLFELYNGPSRVSGMMIGEVPVRKISLTSSIFYLGSNRKIGSAFDTSGVDTFSYYYRDGLGGFTEVVLQTDIDNTQYDDGTGILATLAPNNFGVHWVYVDWEVEHLFVVYGRGSYKLYEAQEAAPPPDLPTVLSDFGILVGKIIIQRNADVFTATLSPFSVEFGVSAVTDHGDLSNVTPDQHHTQVHELGGADHNASTLAELNTKVSDAILIGRGYSGVNPGVNLLDNPSFELDADGTSPPTGWVNEGDGGEVDDAESYEGTKSVKAQSGVGGNGVKQAINVKKGQYITTSVACKTTDALARLYVVPSISPSYSVYHSGSGNWEILSNSYGPFAQNETVTLYLLVQPTGDDAWFDQAVFLAVGVFPEVELLRTQGAIGTIPVSQGDGTLAMEAAPPPGAHDFGGASHTADTWANFATKISDATPLKQEIPGVHPGVNLLSNPSFEVDAHGVSPPTGWLQFAGVGSVDATVRFEGIKSLLISDAQPATTRLYQTFVVKAGQTIIASVWCKASTADHAYLLISATGTPDAYQAHSGSGTWELLTARLTVLANGTSDCYCWKDLAPGNGNVWFDQVVYRVVNEPATRFVVRLCAAADFNAFTANSTWQVNGLDLSAIVPANAIAVHLRGYFSGSTDGDNKVFVLRKNATDAENRLDVVTNVVSTTTGRVFMNGIIAIDSDRKLDYYCQTGLDTYLIYVLGWWIPV